MKITNENELSVNPLTDAEIKYLKRLERLLLKCPERLEFIATGDACLTILDTEGARECDIHDNFASDNGVDLGMIKCAVNIHATTA